MSEYVVLRHSVSVQNVMDLHEPPHRIMTKVGFTGQQLMQMRPAEGTPQMRVETYLSGPGMVHHVRAKGFCSFVDVMVHRPTNHKFVIVELPDKSFCLYDLYDARVSEDQMVLTPGRKKRFQAPEVAIAAVALGW